MRVVKIKELKQGEVFLVVCRRIVPGNNTLKIGQTHDLVRFLRVFRKEKLRDMPWDPKVAAGTVRHHYVAIFKFSDAEKAKTYSRRLRSNKNYAEIRDALRTGISSRKLLQFVGTMGRIQANVAFFLNGFLVKMEEEGERKHGVEE